MLHTASIHKRRPSVVTVRDGHSHGRVRRTLCFKDAVILKQKLRHSAHVIAHYTSVSYANTYTRVSAKMPESGLGSQQYAVNEQLEQKHVCESDLCSHTINWKGVLQMLLTFAEMLSK